MQPNDESKKQIKKDLKVQEKQNAEIRDVLAIERTKFANERTFLAYIRTGLALVGGGLGFINFFDYVAYKWLGGGLIPVGLLVIFFATKQFMQNSERIRKKHQAYTPTSSIHAEIEQSYQNWIKERQKDEEK